MNEDKIKAPGSSNIGVTTASGDIVKVEVKDDEIHLEKSFECMRCHEMIKTLTVNYRCPKCKRRYEDVLI